VKRVFERNPWLPQNGSTAPAEAEATGIRVQIPAECGGQPFYDRNAASPETASALD
jgi:hypothetical protein